MSERFILGTAGHIDHGKTTLIRALTGVDCDRLPEEKERGITIELGFAPLQLPSGRKLGVVDVPGHERLVRTMVSGATGIDLVLFVVAADEGIMPQSREHLSICELLGITRGVVALTKIDTVSYDLLELARMEIEEELANSGLAGAPVVPVSAQTGQGLDVLADTLDSLVAGSEPRTQRGGPAWLPADRTFTMKGFGTVVTGTLRGGTLKEGDNVEVLPEGQPQRFSCKLRGIQVHGKSVRSAAPGQRCALNLQGVELSAVPRGSVIASPGRLDYRPRIQVELQLLPSAPPLRNGMELGFHIGTSERSARLILLESSRIEPGERALVELRFEHPVVAVEGDRFILRGHSRIPGAGWTIGGGRVVDAAPLRQRRSKPERASELRVLAADDRTAALAARLERARLHGLREEELLQEVTSLKGIDGVQVGGSRWLGRNSFEELVTRCVEAVRLHHEAKPLDPWVGLASVTSQLPGHVSRDAVRTALESACERGELESGQSGHRCKGHRARASDDEMAQRLAACLDSAGLAPPTLESLARDWTVPERELRAVAEHLEREGRLVRISSDLYFPRKEIDALRERVTSFLHEHGQLDPAGYKQLTGQTRKYTVPLMEYFDTQKLTARHGNVRVLRGS